MTSILEKIIESYLPKRHITLVRLNEHGEEIPSNIRPETPQDLIAYSIRDLSAITKDMASQLRTMQASEKDERKLLSLEHEIDILEAVIERLKKAVGMVSEAKAYGEEVAGLDQWIPASGGTETPFLSRSGKRLLYCWNPKLQKHAYLDLSTDMILTDEEARAALQTY